MNKRLRFMLCLFIFTSILVLSGCGFLRFTNDNPEEVKLSVNEVLQKAQETMSSLTGYHIITKGQIQQTISAANGTQNNQFSFEFDQKFTNQPPALYSIQKEVNQTGQTTSRELYIVNGVAYTNVGHRWIKQNQPSTKITLSQNPPDLLRFALQANNQGIQLHQDSNDYLLTLDRQAGEGFLGQFFYEAVQSFRSQGVMLTNNDFNVEKFQQQIWIDKNTFKFKKMVTNLEYTVQYRGQNLRVNSHLQVDYQGDYNHQIIVPDHILNTLGN